MDEVLRNMRKTMLDVSSKGKDGNLQSCFSSLEILWTLYNNYIPLTPEGMVDDEKNIFVLSKGQSNLALLTVLVEKGMIERDELDTFCEFDSRISMQADRTKFNGLIETSAGSLGHGFPMATGMAWAKKIKKKGGRVFCLAGDGEMNEGTMWEAALFASSERLNNLVLIIDYNHSIDRMIKIGSLGNKLESFGFGVLRVNGHDCTELESSFNKLSERPIAVLAETIRGYGCKTLMNDRSWFHRYPNENELAFLKREVDEF